MPTNIFTVDLGELSATGGAALSDLEGRMSDAETAINRFEEDIRRIDRGIDASALAANPYLLNKIHLASGVLFGQFLPGYYDMQANSSSITTAYDNDASQCCAISCAPGDVVHVRANGYSGNGTYVFLSASNERIGQIVTGESDGSTAITAPAGAAKLIVNATAAYTNPYVAVGSYTEDDITSIYNKLSKMILMQNNQPAAEDNVLWVDSDGGVELEVLTMADLEGAMRSVNTRLDDIIKISEINALFTE